MPCRPACVSPLLLAATHTEDVQKAIKSTPSVEQVLAGDVEHYDALFIPGGWVLCCLLLCQHGRHPGRHPCYPCISLLLRTARSMPPGPSCRHGIVFDGTSNEVKLLVETFWAAGKVVAGEPPTCSAENDGCFAIVGASAAGGNDLTSQPATCRGCPAPAAVCHGPAGLVTAVAPNGDSILKGREASWLGQARNDSALCFCEPRSWRAVWGAGWLVPALHLPCTSHPCALRRCAPCCCR